MSLIFHTGRQDLNLLCCATACLPAGFTLGSHEVTPLSDTQYPVCSHHTAARQKNALVILVRNVFVSYNFTRNYFYIFAFAFKL
jgi:hypothetical protein